jgi:hypothetical protein
MPCRANLFEPMGMKSELLGAVLPIPPRDPPRETPHRWPRPSGVGLAPRPQVLPMYNEELRLEAGSLDWFGLVLASQPRRSDSQARDYPGGDAGGGGTRSSGGPGAAMRRAARCSETASQ